MSEKNEQVFVTFKWMLVQTLSLIVSIIIISFLITGSIGTKIEAGLASKVSSEKFEERTKSLANTDANLCTLIDQYAKDKQISNDRLAVIEQHLAILVGKPLKVKENKQ